MLLTRGDQGQIEADLVAGRLSCPRCGERLAPHGFGAEREVRTLSGSTRLRARRAICSSCRHTQVIEPCWALPRRRDSAEVVLSAWRLRVAGAGLRQVARSLARPLSTVRRWLAELTTRAEDLRATATRHLHELDACPPVLEPAGTALGDALEAVGQAIEAAVRRFGPRPPSLLGVILTNGMFVPTPTSRAGVKVQRPQRSEDERP